MSPYSTWLNLQEFSTSWIDGSCSELLHVGNRDWTDQRSVWPLFCDQTLNNACASHNTLWKIVGNQSCLQKASINVACFQEPTCHLVLRVHGQIVQSFPFQKTTNPTALWVWHNCFPYFGKRSCCSLGRLQLWQWRQNWNTIPFPHGEALMKAPSALYGLERILAPGTFCCTLLISLLLLPPCWYDNRAKASFRIHSHTPPS